MPWAEALAEPSTLASSQGLDSIVFIGDVKHVHLSDTTKNENNVWQNTKLAKYTPSVCVFFSPPFLYPSIHKITLISLLLACFLFQNHVIIFFTMYLTH